MRYGHYGDGMGWGLSPGGWILMILFWIALATVIVVGLIALFRMLNRPAHAHGPLPQGGAPHVGPPPPPEQSAQKILDARFARGEIDIDEYRLRGDELRAPRPAAPEPPPPPPPV